MKDSYCSFITLTKWSTITYVVKAVAIFRQLSLFTVVLSPGRTNLSHSSPHTFLCQSRGRWWRTPLTRNPLICAICLSVLSWGNAIKWLFSFPPSFSVLWDCVLSPILRIWTSRDPATLNNFSFPFVLAISVGEITHIFPSNTVKGKAILRLLLSRPILFSHYCSDFKDVISGSMDTEAKPARRTLGKSNGIHSFLKWPVAPMYRWNVLPPW